MLEEYFSSFNCILDKTFGSTLDFFFEKSAVRHSSKAGAIRSAREEKDPNSLFERINYNE